MKQILFAIIAISILAAIPVPAGGPYDCLGPARKKIVLFAMEKAQLYTEMKEGRAPLVITNVSVAQVERLSDNKERRTYKLVGYVQFGAEKIGRIMYLPITVETTETYYDNVLGIYAGTGFAATYSRRLWRTIYLSGTLGVMDNQALLFGGLAISF